ncbi:MAG: hypothetical protein ACR2RB_10800 [Gammaproteobacteria bacterium]
MRPTQPSFDQEDVWNADKLTVSLAKMRTLEAKHGAETPLADFPISDSSTMTFMSSVPPSGVTKA